jgi:hypothetical protein
VPAELGLVVLAPDEVVLDDVDDPQAASAAARSTTPAARTT